MKQEQEIKEKIEQVKELRKEERYDELKSLRDGQIDALQWVLEKE